MKIQKNRQRAGLIAASIISATAFAGTSAVAALIDGSGITASASSEYNNNCLVVNTVNQSGLTVITGEYSITNAISWFAGKNDSPASENWIQWDLGDVYTLSTIQVWNVNQITQGDWRNNGIGTVDIYVSGSSTDPGDPEGAGAANWTLWAENATFSKAPGLDTYTGFDLATEVGQALPASGIRWVRFEVDAIIGTPTQNYSSNAGLAEIQFDGTATGGGNNYADWIADYPGVGVLTAFDDDTDGDGNGNGVENFFGTDPDVFTAGLVSGELSGNTFTFTHPLNTTPADDISATYRWSTDLATFTDDGAAAGGTTVDFVQGAPSGGMVTVTATVSGTAVDKLFVSIEVTQN